MAACAAAAGRLVVELVRTYREDREAGLKMLRHRRKRFVGMGQLSKLMPTSLIHNWLIDFIWDRILDGRRLRGLNLVDEFAS